MAEPIFWQQVFVTILVGVVFFSFIKEWIRPDLVAMGALILCLLTGILKEDTLAHIFGRSAPIVIACMFILSAALERTGVIEAMGARVGDFAGNSEWKLMLVLILVVAPLSAFVNNTPVVVVFMPIILQICRKYDLKAYRFLIPLSYLSIAGGTCTLIGTSTNLLASDIAFKKGLEPFGMFEMAKLGIIFVAITGAYTYFIGRRLIPERSTLSTLFESSQTREFLTQGVVGPESRLIGKLVTDTPLATRGGVRIVQVIRQGKQVRTPLNRLRFKEGDLVIFKSPVSDMMEMSNDGVGLEFGLDRMTTKSAVLMEGIIGPDSSLVGKTLKQLNFRQRFGVIAIAVHRRGVNLRERFENVKLAFGDTLLVQGSAEEMNRLFAQKDFVNLSQPVHRPLRRTKAPFAIAAILLFMVFGSLAGPLNMPIVAFSLAAVFLVLVTNTLDTKDAYDSIDWKVIFLIFGMLGLGQALQATHLVSAIGQFAKDTFGHYDGRVMVAVLYLLAAILTEMISNNAVATLMTPLAFVIGVEMGYDPRPFVIAIMFGSSASFSTPIGYQTNTYVYGAGGYKFADFTRVGLPLALLLWLTASLLIPSPWFWPLEIASN